MSILAYAPQDLTVVVTADTTLAALQECLAEHGQWLPLDPPNPQRVTIGEIIANDLSGPRRYRYGTIREHVLSLTADLANGRRIKAGANVVKNAAGYDLCRLFTGSRGELAAVREACFKVQPKPEAEQFVYASFASVEAAWKLVEEVDTSPLTPVVLDLHNAGGTGPWTVVIGFAGMREEVAWQRTQAQRLAELTDADLTGCSQLRAAAFVGSALRTDGGELVRGADPTQIAQGHLAYDREFWGQVPTETVRKVSVLPSTLLETIRRLELESLPLLARAGNGIVYYRGGPQPPWPEVPIDLMRRLKHEFDPKHQFPWRA